MNTEELLFYIIELFIYYLDELNGLERNDFTHGEMTAYVETLEIIQYWNKSKNHGLNYKIEDKYKI